MSEMQFEPGWYWLEDGLRTPAVRYGMSGQSCLVIVNMYWAQARPFVGLDDWFAADFVEYWNGLVPECCDEGTGPGQWSKANN